MPNAFPGVEFNLKSASILTELRGAPFILIYFKIFGGHVEDARLNQHDYGKTNRPHESSLLALNNVLSSG